MNPRYIPYSLDISICISYQKHPCQASKGFCGVLTSSEGRQVRCVTGKGQLWKCGCYRFCHSWQKQFRWHLVVNEGISLFLFSALFVIKFTWPDSEGQLQSSSHHQLCSWRFVCSEIPTGYTWGVNLARIIQGCLQVWGFRGINKKRDSNCFAQCNKRILLTEQQGRIKSFSRQKKPNHYAVFAVLLLQK